jgi:hypothetical protein
MIIISFSNLNYYDKGVVSKKRNRVENKSETKIDDVIAKKLCYHEKQLKDCFKSMTETLLCLAPVVLNMNKSLETLSEFTLQPKYQRAIGLISNQKFVQELLTMNTTFHDASNPDVMTPLSESELISKLFQCTSFCARVIVALHLDTSNLDDQVRYVLYLFIFYLFILFL